MLDVTLFDFDNLGLQQVFTYKFFLNYSKYEYVVVCKFSIDLFKPEIFKANS